MKYKRYSKYKNSGVEWLGEVPEHWEIMKLKQICDKSALYGANEPSTSYISEGIRFLRTSDIDDNGELLPNNAVYLEFSKIEDYMLDDGDLLLSRSGTIGRSFLFSKQKHGKCAYAGYLVRFIFKHWIIPKYFFYFTKTLNFNAWLSFSVIQSTIGNLNGQKYANISLTVPSSSEQKTIANFLDRETNRIDELIAKKQWQIELLKEKRQALITHAVTKGLDPNVKMKNSGVEWLGEVPEHWDIRKLKYVAYVLPSNVDKHSFDNELPVRLCNYTDVYNNDEITENLDLMKATATQAEILKFKLNNDDVIVTKDSESWEDIAVPAHVRKPLNNVVCGYHLTLIRPLSDTVDGIYLFYAFCASSVNYQYRVETTGVTRFGLGSQRLAGGIFTLPPIAEQKTIANFLDRETARIDELSEKIKASINLLKEYRSALISIAVTGKIDVREEVAKWQKSTPKQLSRS